MTIFPVLKTPDGFPRWATDSGRVLEPSSGVKDTGWQIDDVPPARWMNWLQNLQYEWNQYHLRQQIANWRFCDYNTKPAPGTSQSVIYNQEDGIWWIIGTNGANGEAWYSYDGHNFTLQAASLVGNLPNEHCIAIDSANLLVGTDDGIKYRPNATGVWALIANAAIGLASGPTTIITKYSTSDFIMAYAAGTVFIESTGVTGGSWVAATTDPPSPPAGAPTGTRFIWATGNTFYLMITGVTGPSTKVYTSTDNGDNWAAMSNHPLASDTAYEMAYNPDTGRLIVVGNDATPTSLIEYTDDAGATAWSSATIDYGDVQSPYRSPQLRSVYYCGNNVWIAGGNSSALNGQSALFLVSIDDGETWAYGFVKEDTNTTDNGIIQVAGCPRYLVAINTDGNFISLTNASYTL